MRPLRLEVEGFTCYRERQQPLDFSSLSLFAIAGPTGAGKSSILDTLLYALYGEVPRIGKQGIGEFISHGRDVMSVCLDFRVLGRDYRITRVSKRSKHGALKTDATLADITGGLEKSLADQVRAVNEKINALLGLGYEEFIQTVVLPQGQFAQFLKADPKDQRAILQHLLRHDVFTRMRDTAEERRKALDSQVQVLDGKLSTYQDATPTAIESREARLLEVRGQVQQLAVASAAADAALQEAQQRHAITGEVAQLRLRRQEAAQQAPVVERSRVELDQSRRAAPIVPRLEAADEARTRASHARQAKELAATKAAEADLGRARVLTEWEAATAAAVECAALMLRVQALDEIAAEIVRRDELTASLTAIVPRIVKAEAEVKAAAKSEASVRKKLTAARSAMQALKSAHDAVPFDEPLYLGIESTFARVVEARSQERDLAALTTEAGSAAQAQAAAVNDEKTARAAHHTADQQAQAAAGEAAAAKRAHDDGRTRHGAAALRQHLHAGDQCPVCLQAVAELPALPAPPELAGLERAERAAADRASKADAGRQAAFNALAGASARLVSASTAAESAVAKVRARATALAALLATVSAAVPGAPAADAGGAVLDWFERCRTELLTARTGRDRHAQALRNAETDLSTAEVALAHATADEKGAVVRHEQLVLERTRLEKDLAGVVARIQGVTTSADPKAERQAVVERVDRLRDAERTTREALTQLDRDATAANERLRAAGASTTQADKDVTSADALLAQALAAAGFAATADVKAAMRTPAQQAALELRVTAFDQQQATIASRLAEIEPQVAGREVSASALAEVADRRKSAFDAWQAATQQTASLANEVAILQKQVEARTALTVERDTVQAVLDVTAEMATDLKGDRFQAYLLEEAFNALVAGASVRMRAISNRYTLEWKNGEFYVVDHDNAGERRRADTLSGGETFMAALCLALQLSDEVLRTSGALQMDSLFIDEGFGTLDAESLAEVTDAIEALGQDGNRLIGVISHRADLTDRMPGCIRIDKGAGESRWVMERAG